MPARHLHRHGGTRRRPRPHRPRGLGHLPHALAWGRILMRRSARPRSSPAAAGEVSASSPTEGACASPRRHTAPTALPPPPSRTRAPPPRCAWGRILMRRSTRDSSSLRHARPRSSPAAAGEVSASSPTEGACASPRRYTAPQAQPPPPSRTRAPPPRCAWGRILCAAPRDHAPPPRQRGRWPHAQRADGGGLCITQALHRAHGPAPTALADSGTSPTLRVGEDLVRPSARDHAPPPRQRGTCGA
jgi:hypothetical protein